MNQMYAKLAAQELATLLIAEEDICKFRKQSLLVDWLTVDLSFNGDAYLQETL